MFFSFSVIEPLSMFVNHLTPRCCVSGWFYDHLSLDGGRDGGGGWMVPCLGKNRYVIPGSSRVDYLCFLGPSVDFSTLVSFFLDSPFLLYLIFHIFLFLLSSLVSACSRPTRAESPIVAIYILHHWYLTVSEPSISYTLTL